MTRSLMQLATPDSSSEHVKWTVTSARYQPFALGSRVTPPTMPGGVLSMLSIAGSVALLPAPFTTVPLTDSPRPSLVTLRELVQVATPDSPLAHKKFTNTSVLFQPLAFGGGDWVCVMVGGVLSILSWMRLVGCMLTARSSLQNLKL